MCAASSLTPMFRQYQALKREQAGSILLYRMGDFYEMFFEDAKVASRLLDLTLTARGKGTDNAVPMCGFPHHQLDAYCARLVRADCTVAICDQVEDPKKTKGLVRREVVRVVTPGTLNDPDELDATSNLWIAAAARSAGRLGIALLDASTGEMLAWDRDGDGDDAWDELCERLESFAPREVVLADDLAVPAAGRARLEARTVLSETDPFGFGADESRRLLLKQFGVASLDGFGLRDRGAAVAAAGGLLQYVRDTQRAELPHVDAIRLHEPSTRMALDPATRRNLELERGLRDGGREGSLLVAIDRTVTAGGGRLLRRRLVQPLLDPAAIGERLDAVDALVGDGETRERLREALRGVHDIERLLSRTVTGTARPRDLTALGASLGRVPDLLLLAAELGAPALRRELDGLDPCADLAARLAAALVDEPPASIRDGGVMREGFDAELDELRAIRRDGRAYIAALEADERECTGIASLKVRYNKVFGYFIEVSKANLHLVPDTYQRKQTIANGERYITPELKTCEAKILGAQDRMIALEAELFRALREEIAGHAPRLKAVARACALLDLTAGLAECAARQELTRPVVDDGATLSIVGGRHPVVERHLADRRFVPNDTELVAGGAAIAVLTGPNMGGKSTYLRQVALIQLLAQIGSFVPAERATLGIVDRVFCRVGASDSLAEGQSTFMVEMTETANILRHASSRSLILLDEIGRGTSTFDGLSIAWAVVEHLAALAGGAPRTLFATHYHELTELAVELTAVLNLRMAVRERGGDVVFLHRVEQGAADRSYGIHVARLAGVPDDVVQRAGQILQNLERDEYGGDGSPRRARRDDGVGQRGLFDADADPPPGAPAAEILAELREADPSRLTPLEALTRLDGWRRRLSDADGER